MLPQCHKAKNFVPGKEAQSTKVWPPSPAPCVAHQPTLQFLRTSHLHHFCKQIIFTVEDFSWLLQVAACVQHIQNELSKARVVYCSATGVSEVGNMAFMTRLVRTFCVIACITTSLQVAALQSSSPERTDPFKGHINNALPYKVEALRCRACGGQGPPLQTSRRSWTA